MDGGGARGRMSRSRRGRGPDRGNGDACAAGCWTRSPGPSRARRSRRQPRPPAGRARRPPMPTGSTCCPTCRPAALSSPVAATGFAPQRFEAVTLRVGQVLDLDATLTVAGVREDVVVDATGAGLVDTARSVVDAVITGALHRPAAAQRPQLHGAGAARARQRAGAELRSDQDQLRGHLVGRAARPRRQHHHRRHGQQRRHGGRAAAQHRPGGRAGVPDRHQPVCRGPWTLGRLGHQRRHPVGRRRVARLRVDVLPRRRHAGRAGHGRPQPGSAAV